MAQKVIDLLAAAFENPSLQQNLHAANTPESFVKIAAENGYELTKEELVAALRKVHIVFGEVVQSMMSELMGGAETTNSLTTEKVSGTHIDMIKRLFSRGEAFDSEGFITFFTDPPLYQFGNFEVCLDKESIKKSADNFFSRIDAVYHEIKMMWEVADLVFVEMDVAYWRKDGSMVSLPCTDIFRIEGDKFSELRIFMDVNPVFDPTIPVPESASVLTVSEGRKLLPPGTMRKHFAEHPEGKQRVAQGYAPKWSIAGPRWPIGGESQMSSEQLKTVGELSQAVMAQDWDKVKSHLTDDILYKVGSSEPVYGPQAVVDFFKQTFQNTAVFTGHDARKVWEEPNIITIEMDAHYQLVSNKKTVTVACCDVYRLRGNKVNEWRVYADMSPWNEAQQPVKKAVTIDKNDGSTVVMVVFSVDPSQQQQLLDNIMAYGGADVSHQPGFISSTLHKSIDGRRIVNYTQWRSREDYETFARKSLTSKAPKIFQTIPPDIHIYEIVQQTVAGDVPAVA
jgi:predicted ribosomally synthesized peptide with nif11-like leader